MPKKKPDRAPRRESLLIELLTEELPPKSLKRMSEAFANGVFEGLKEKHFLDAHSKVEPFASPRRLGARISGVNAKQPDRAVERKGLSVQMGLDVYGQPTRALLGFARSCGVDVSKLERRKDEKSEYFVYQAKQKGEPLANHLSMLVETSLKNLPVTKLMRWGSSGAQFVRPVHGVILLHGSKPVPGSVLGLTSGNKTFGHRFLSKGAVTVKRAADYEKTLEKQGKVVVSFETRREGIVRELDKAAAKLGKGATWRLGKGKEMDLVDEVAGTVESTHVGICEFDSAFLDLPTECLIVSMQQHQKYFPVKDSNGKLLSQFLFVSNMPLAGAHQIARGNERVLRARLADARFFYDQDRKTKLADRVPRLADVVYQNKLGSQLERVNRIKKVAVEIAHKVRATVEWVERAAYLSKADLLTEMVGEFPELQGVMGYHYALHDHEEFHVAEYIREHYLPRYAGDELPNSADSICLALADKLDTLVGIYGVGLVPTGDKDPFGLRRQALGVVRILVERRNLPSLSILELLQLSRDCFPTGVIADGVVSNLHAFIIERLKFHLRDKREKRYAPDEIDAVLAFNPTQLDQVLRRLDAIKKFRALPEATALAAANKRIRNILRQAKASFDGVANPDLFKESAERSLYQEVVETRQVVDYKFSTGEYTESLLALASLRPHVDRFFDEVLVNAEDAAVRENRLRLLGELAYLLNRVADISMLAVEK